MSDLQYKNSKLSGTPENPVKTTNQLDLGSGSFRGAAAPWSLNAGGSSLMEAGGRGGPRSLMSDWMASAGLLGERFSPINAMMSGLTSSDVSAGLRGVEKTPTGGNFLGLGLGGKDTAQSKYGTSSIWGGGGLGLGGSAWDGKSESGTQYKGYSGGLGGVGNLGYDWSAGGFGQGGNYNLYRGVGGSAYSMDGGGKRGYGAEGSYTPIGLANSSQSMSLGPLGKGQVGVENAYLNKQSVSGQAYVDDNGKYVAEGMYAKRMGADNVTAHAENALGTADASIGHTSKGMEVKGDGFLRRYSPCGRCGGVGMIQQDPCAPCSGRGSRREKRSFHVRLPPGTESGAEKVVEGQGEPGQFGGAPGHLRVTVNLRPHPWLRREGLDIVGELYVSLGEAARGGKLPVPTLTGSALVEIPAGVTTGAKLRLRGKGVPAEAGRPGDQIVTVVIETPRITTAAGAPATHLGSALDALERAFEADPQLLPKRAAQRGGA